MTHVLSAAAILSSLLMVGGKDQAAVSVSANRQPQALVHGKTPSTATTPLPGVVMPRNQVMLSAPLEAGLMTLHVEVGDTVEKDQVLAVMDNRVAQAAVEVARMRAESKGRLREARYALEHAKAEHEQISRMRSSQAASEHELLVARHTLDRAQAAVQIVQEDHAVAGAALRLEQQILERHSVRAPFTGTVMKTVSTPGEMLATSTPILVMADLTALEAELHLPVSLYGDLETGRMYQLSSQAPVSRTIMARLRQAEPVIDPASRTFKCVFDIDNSKGQLPIGFSVELAAKGVSGSVVGAAGEH